jgi:hypothetical protein
MAHIHTYSDAGFKKYVEAYAKDGQLFFDDFAAAFGMYLHTEAIHSCMYELCAVNSMILQQPLVCAENYVYILKQYMHVCMKYVH